MRDVLSNIKRFFIRFTRCLVVGHRSTGTMLWWMCDHCHADFTDNALPSTYTADGKLTVSSGLIG